MVQALEKYAKTESGGYHGLKNVESVKSPVIDNMESFFLGETLKYLVRAHTSRSVASLCWRRIADMCHTWPVTPRGVRCE